MFHKVVIPECGAARRVRESVFAVVVPLRNDRSPTKTFGDDDKKHWNKVVIKIKVILNLFQDLLIVSLVFSVLFNNPIGRF